MTASRSPLRALAERVGILSVYVDASHQTRRTSDDTRRALLAAMGYESPTDRAARAWLQQLEHERQSELLAPVRVVTRGSRAARVVPVRLPTGAASARVELAITEERGRTRIVTRAVRGSANVALPSPLGTGYQRVQLRVAVNRREQVAEQLVIVTPPRCVLPQERLGARGRATGLAANLYSVRRDGDWGVGDLTTLTMLARAAARGGAAFVGINPLHAVTNRGTDFGPYGPTSRLFRNPVYIDVERVAELPHSAAARDMLQQPQVGAQRRALQGAELLDYEGVWALKSSVLHELHRTFRERTGTRGNARRRAYDEFLRRTEPHLTAFATWMALAERHRVADWRQFPHALREPEGHAALVFRTEAADALDFHRWLQFEMDAQLGHAAQAANAAGMRVGLYQDLAAGSSPGGSDAWNHPALFASRAHIGAPPDPLAPQGQNWGLAPLDPHALRAQRFEYWTRLVRGSLQHSGALRIDHVLGLFRSFWVPEGGTGRDGAYVRMPVDDLFGVLALESARGNALIVGEDLGTVPPEVPRVLRRRGVLSTRVLYFERDRSGFRPAHRYPSEALATANTHDLATLCGWWEGRDVAFRTRHGQHGAGISADAAERARARERRQLLRLLRLPAPRDDDPEFVETLVDAVHGFLGSTRARLVAISLDDLMGECDPVNVPGAGQDLYPSWRRRTRRTLDTMTSLLARNSFLGAHS